MFWCLAYVAVLLLLGYAVLSAVLGSERRGVFELVGASIGLGAGTLGLLFFFASLAGMVPSRRLLVLFGLSAAAALLALGKSRRLALPGGWGSREPLTPRDGMTLGVLLLFLYAAAAVASHALAFPLYEWDAFAIWGLKAKVVAAQPLRECADYFQDGTLSYSHQDYPLLIPFLIAGLYGAVGEVNESAGRLIFPLLFLGFATLLYGGLRRKLTRPLAATLAAAGAAAPILLRWSGAGVADPALSFFHLGGVLFLADWLDRFQKQDLILAGLFSAFAAFTKNEGLALLLLNTLAATLFSLRGIDRQRCITMACVAAGALALLLPWLVFRHGLPKSHENYADRLTLSTFVENASRLKLILPAFLAQMTDWKQWGPIWLLLPLSAALGRQALLRRGAQALWLLLILHLALYVTIYVVTPWNVVEQMQISLDRLLLHVLPTAAVLIRLHLQAANMTAPPNEERASPSFSQDVQPPP